MRPRHHEPLLWVLFGAGGMFAALAMPALILVAGVLWPLDIGTASHSQAAQAVGHPAARLILGTGLALVLWHGAHRIRHGLHDLGLPTGPLVRALTYGLALAATGGLIVLILAL